MIGNDPRYQAIIDQYTSGAYNAPYQSIDYSPSPYYNPIYDIRSQQIASGELPAGSRFPNPQLDTSVEETTPTESFDPCPPGYQLIDGVCQPDTMFQQGGRDNDRTPFVKNITDGVIDGYERVLPNRPIGIDGGLNSREMMALEKRLTPEIASAMGLMNQKYLGRGIQYNPTTGNYIAASPTGPKLYPFDEMSWGTALGDARRAFDSTLGGFGNMGTGIFNAAKDYLANGGMLGMLANAFSPKTSSNRSQGGSTTNVGLLNNVSASSGGADRAEPAQGGNSFPSSYDGNYQGTPSAEEQRFINDVLKSKKKDRTPTPTPKKVKINAPAFKGMGYRKGR